ncbi:uncharacterized protein LOC117563015 [Gymnodraco acuticeps]|uniref:Uncharacterized protein LOC117563015 n=1 Tax=Gymnodraco acuticeps TaxID=8218 RepID=A0A6P8WHJ1_GYMAC|nr:uncharacterized protein LOC117563015 [Gymnodraco acuticeps]
MEQETISLLAEQQKRNNRQSIKEKMAKALGYRRQEIVHRRPSIEGLLERWPALFHMEEVNAELMRITTFPLETKFLAQLDKHSTKLLQVIRSRGGVVKQKTTGILQVLDETVDITIRRECILKSLMIYLGEPVDHLIKEFQDAEAGELEQATMETFVTGKEDQFHRPKDVKVLIEGTEVLSGLPSVVTAFAMLFGLIYALKWGETCELVQAVNSSTYAAFIHNAPLPLYNQPNRVSLICRSI